MKLSHSQYKYFTQDYRHACHRENINVSPPYCWVLMYAGYVACLTLVSHDEYVDGQTDRQMPDRYTILSARCLTKKQTPNFFDLVVCKV